MENYTTNKWGLHITGATVPAYVNNVIPAFEGDYVLQINDAGDTYAAAGVLFGLFSNLKHRVELAWWKDANTAYMWPYFHFLNGTNERAADIRYDNLSNRWMYVPSSVSGFPAAADWVAIPDADENIEDNTWNHVKIEVDLQRGVYSRLVTNLLDIDLTALPLRSFTRVGALYYTNLTLIKITGGVGQAAYFDDVRVYINVR